MDYHRNDKYRIVNIIRSAIPGNPRDLKELDEMLVNYRPTQGFYRGMVKGADDSLALIFLNENVIDGLENCNQLFADGTFEVYLILISSH